MVSINCTTEDHLELDQLTEFQGGLKNRTDGDYAKIIVSIQKYGFSFPFFVWNHDGINHVLDGHGRLGALKKLKAQGEVIPPLPVVYVNCGNEENAKNLLLRLNSQYGQMTAESVMEFMSGFEFDPYEISLPAGVLDLNIDPPVTVDDDEAPEPELDAPAISRPGEIYQLGPHRLMCGDSTKDEDVAILMDGNVADIAFTSPPYNAGFGANITKDNGRSKYTNGSDDNKTQDEYYDFLSKYLNNADTYSMFNFCNIQILANNKKALFHMIGDRIDRLADIIIWDKTRSQPQLADNVLNSEFEFVLCFSEKGNRSIGTIPFHGTLKNIVHISPGKNEYAAVHNAVFPVELPAYFIEKIAKNSVLDLFGGSGTTMIAAQKTGKTCYMMEIDPHYCDVIRRRWTQWCKENGVEPGEGALE